MTAPTKRRIVILGGGFGGAYCARTLEKRLNPDEAEIVLIDRHNYFVFYPLLVEAGTGSLEPRHSVVAIRTLLKRTAFRMAEIAGVDFDHRTVSYRIEGTDTLRSLTYDQLVIALGSATNLPGIPGLADHGFEIKSLTDAVSLRDRAIQLLERAEATEDYDERRALLHYVVVGGNFTGVEVAGEFDVVLKEASRHYANVRASDCKVTLIEIADRILTALEPDLAEYATNRLRSRGVDVRLNSTVSKIERERLVLDNDEPLAAHTVIWCAGIAPNPLIADWPLPVDERGYIECEDNLQVSGFPNVWAIGDCAVNRDPEGNAYPATAQHAVGQARAAAENIQRVLRDEPPRPCVLSSKGALAALGCRTAVAKVFGVKVSGLPAWFLWRTVYLFKMPGWARRLRIALDWTMDFFFKKDHVQLGVHRVKDQSRRSPTGSDEQCG